MANRSRSATSLTYEPSYKDISAAIACWRPKQGGIYADCGGCAMKVLAHFRDRGACATAYSANHELRRIKGASDQGPAKCLCATGVKAYDDHYTSFRHLNI